MKIKAIILMMLAFCFTINLNAQNIETKTHEVNDVKNIAVSGNVNIYIKQGNSSTVEIKATAKQHKKMEVKISGNGVSVSYKNGKRKEKPVEVYLNVQNLSKIAASTGADVIFENQIKTDKLIFALSGGSDLVGSIDVDKLTGAASAGSDIDLKDSKADDVDIAASGGSDFVADNFETKTMNVVISGGSDVDLSGVCEKMNLVASGGSDCDASKFETQKCNIVVSGGSDADIYVTDELSIVASGASDVDCKGNPEIKNKRVAKNSDFNME